jgi:hypothetical protein
MRAISREMDCGCSDHSQNAVGETISRRPEKRLPPVMYLRSPTWASRRPPINLDCHCHLSIAAVGAERRKVLYRTDTLGVLSICWSVLSEFLMTNCALLDDQCRVMVVGTAAPKLPRPDLACPT